jgi:hypothetical protein
MVENPLELPVPDVRFSVFKTLIHYFSFTRDLIVRYNQ